MAKIPKKTIYLDHHATTPCDPRVVDAMLPYFTSHFGNPGSNLHSLGREAADAVDLSREKIAEIFGVRPKELVFTSGATESNNLALIGTSLRSMPTRRRQVITTAIEHKSVLETGHHLAEQGLDLRILPVGSDGRIDLSEFKKSLSDKTLLISVQAANNEIGTLQDITAISDLAHSFGAIVHCDAAQIIGKIPFDLLSCGADLISISAHKIYGPKGIGLLFLRGGVRNLPISPIQFGGGQEFGLRPGTQNVPAIVGFTKALELALTVSTEQQIGQLRDRFEKSVMSGGSAVRRNGFINGRLPGNSSLTFPGIDAEALITNVPELALSTGSACTSGAPDPSHVLTAIGLSRADALSTIRVGLGRGTTAEDVDYASQLLVKAAAYLRTSSSHSISPSR